MKDFVIRIIEKAGQYLLENFRRDLTLISERRISKDLVTKYDQRNNDFLVNQISKKYPTHNILAEESGLIDKESEYTWIIDPLDGTANFITGNPFFSVSIALARKNEVILGVIKAPFLNELFVAEKNKGAFLNGRKIKVSNIDQIEEAYFLSCGGGDKNNERIAKINSVIHPKTKDLRKLGSGALEGAWVACGRADAYFAPQIYPWDIAAAALLVREAGGKVTDFEDKEWKPKPSNVVLSNGKIHSKLLELINKAL